FCLETAGDDVSEVDYVGFYDKPLLKFDRLLETWLAFAPRGYRAFAAALPPWLGEKLHIPRILRKQLGGSPRNRFVFAEHHESHAASAFFPSPFQDAAVLTMDGVGEWATTSVAVGRGNKLEMVKELRFPHSLGLFYSAFTYYTGFRVNSGEYKLMGLAPYGEPRFVDLMMKELLDLKDDGSFRLNLDYFDYPAGTRMTGAKMEALFGEATRTAEGELSQFHMDIAASVQAVTAEVVLRTARYVHDLTGLDKLCLAGGVALNCVGNGRILREGPFDDIWIQPASGDAGGALGVATLIWHHLLNKPRRPTESDTQKGSLLGPSYGNTEVRALLEREGVAFENYEGDETGLLA
ncbi:MAG TPA: carbamoyltransferase N-terminal domain-containing protein, partial [Planctomycetota bacterium]|nr:carbamoyltransferase N-terminal domain-containing protein [Planctomycetota bacterium]